MMGAGTGVERVASARPALATRRSHASFARIGARRQRGFILTLELIILLSVFGVVFLFGFSMFQEYIINRIGDFFGNKIYIFDSTAAPDYGQLIGKMLDTNAQETPLVVYRDGTFPVILGVRSDAFTTRMRVYYIGDNCAGTEYILNPQYAASITLKYGGSTLNGVVQPVSDFYTLVTSTSGTGGRAYAIGLTQELWYVEGTDGIASQTIDSYYDSEYGSCFDFGASSYNLDGLSAATDSGVDLATVFPKGAVGYWIPATTNSITTTTTIGGFGGFPAATSESTAPSNLGAPANTTTPCPEGTAGCPGL